MKSRYPLDPDDEDTVPTTEQTLSEALPPIELPPERSGALRRRLFDRVRQARDAGRAHIRVAIVDAEWKRMLPGVRVHRLDAARRAVILDLAPGSAIPFHRHREDEECVVLRGEARLGDVVVRSGDYHLARPNSRHGIVTSPAGALLYLRGTPLGHGAEVVRDVAAGLLPGQGSAPMTIRRDEGTWRARGGGLETKLLREDGESRSLLLRVPPGASLQADGALFGDECLLVEGEATLDDWAMQPGDYLRAGRGAAALGSESGAVLFVRAPV